MIKQMKSKILQNENFTLILTEGNDEVFSTKSGTPFNNDINNEANPSKIIYDKIGMTVDILLKLRLEIKM